MGVYQYRFDLNPKPDIGIGMNSRNKYRYWYRFAVYRYDCIGIRMAISVEPYSITDITLLCKDLKSLSKHVFRTNLFRMVRYTLFS